MNFKRVLAGVCAGAMVASMYVMPAFADEAETVTIDLMGTEYLGTDGNHTVCLLTETDEDTGEVKALGWADDNGYALSEIVSITYVFSLNGLDDWDNICVGTGCDDNGGWGVTGYPITDLKADADNNVTMVVDADFHETDTYAKFYGGDWQSATLIDAKLTYKEHVASADLVDAKDATCTEAGYTGDVVCATCGNVITAGTEIAATGHDEGAVDSDTVVDATCTEDGYTGDVKCTVCGEKVADGETVLATGHDYGEDGYCTKCGKLNPELCAHDGDTEIAKAADATCTEDGYTGDKVCVICGDVLEAGKVIPATDHDEGKLDESTAKAATCTEAGKEADLVCGVCGEVITAGAEIPATGHTYVDGVCSVCGEKDPSVVETEGTKEETEPASESEEPTTEENGDGNETGDRAPVAALAVAVVSAMGIALVASKKKFNA